MNRETVLAARLLETANNLKTIADELLTITNAKERVKKATKKETITAKYENKFQKYLTRHGN